MAQGLSSCSHIPVSHLKADWGGAAASVVVHSRDCRLVLVGRIAGVTSDTWAT